VDTEARRQLLATTRHFDQVGQAIWQQLFDRGFDTAQTAAA
ncbi:PaaX family transcriptional regulator, partial [Enterococcus hirae]